MDCEGLSSQVNEQNQLGNTLEAWNFQHLEVNGDGNCLFVAIITSLILNREHPENQQITAINGMPAPLGNEVDIVRSLRSAVVAEWTGEHSSQYQSFLTVHQLNEVAENYLHMSELILPALYNILSTPIVLFTNIDNLPIIVQYPTNTNNFNTETIYLTFDQLGAHYGVAIQIPQEDSHLQSNDDHSVVSTVAESQSRDHHVLLS